jgi:hypothetical protein
MFIGLKHERVSKRDTHTHTSYRTLLCLFVVMKNVSIEIGEIGRIHFLTLKKYR